MLQLRTVVQLAGYHHKTLHVVQQNVSARLIENTGGSRDVWIFKTVCFWFVVSRIHQGRGYASMFTSTLRLCCLMRQVVPIWLVCDRQGIRYPPPLDGGRVKPPSRTLLHLVTLPHRHAGFRASFRFSWNDRKKAGVGVCWGKGKTERRRRVGGGVRDPMELLTAFQKRH